MAKYGKWIGAGLGFVMGGPIGALFGYFIGSTFDTATMVASAPGNDPGTRPTGRGDFLLSLVVLDDRLDESRWKSNPERIGLREKILPGQLRTRRRA